MKVELQKACLTNFEFEKDLSELRKENHILKGQLQKFHEDDQNSTGQMEDNIFALNKQVEEVKKTEEDLTRQLQEKIEICQKQELKILSLKEDLDKTISQLKTNSKIDNNSEYSMEEEEKTNIYTRILKRFHDQQESREITAQRYPMMFNGYCYKCNNYGHKAIHCRDHEKITPRRNQDGFSI